MKQKKQNALSVLLEYAGSHRRLTLLGLGLSAVSMVCSMIPYLCIWLAARDLIAVAPDWTQARSVTDYGWIAFAFAVGGILIYFLGLMCTHLAAFRTAANIRKQGMAHVMQAPLGYFDANASSLSVNFLFIRFFTLPSLKMFLASNYFPYLSDLKILSVRPPGQLFILTVIQITKHKTAPVLSYPARLLVQDVIL